jgi:hypothetical protein
LLELKLVILSVFILHYREYMEPKLPLLWGKVLSLSLRQCDYSGDCGTAARRVCKLVQSLLQLAEDRTAGWGILGAIGLCKHSALSVRLEKYIGKLFLLF